MNIMKIMAQKYIGAQDEVCPANCSPLLTTKNSYTNKLQSVELCK